MNLQFCWIVRQDMPAILEIERASYVDPWCEAEFLDALLEQGCIGVAAKLRRMVVGFLLYHSHPRSLEIVKLAVSTELRRCGIGSGMLSFLKEKLSRNGRNELTACVADDSLTAQLFLREQGFRAIAVLRDYFEQHDGDAYLMKFALDNSRREFHRLNRLSRYFDLEV